MERFESILFSYNNKDRIEYQLYAEVLRFMGIYVCQDVLSSKKDKDRRLNASDFSVHYNIDGADDWRGDNESINLKLSALGKKLELHISDEDFFNCYRDICEVFVRYRLLQETTVLQHFKVKSEPIFHAGKQFEKAADDLSGLLDSRQELKKNRYARYANLYCKQKANSSRYLCGERLIYFVDKLAEQGLCLIEDFGDFSNAWVLLGQICEKSKDFFVEAVDAYQRAIRQIEDKPFASNVYYWLGKCLEQADGRISQRAQAQYRRAYRCFKKYRNIYKMAIPYKNAKDWKAANTYFLKCIEYIKEKGSFLDPSEQEYYFKVNVFVSYCYLKQGDYLNTIKYAENAITLKKQLSCGLNEEVQETEFYRKLYGKDANQYISLMLLRMGESKIHSYLSVAYFELQMPREAEQHQEYVRL